MAATTPAPVPLPRRRPGRSRAAANLPPSPSSTKSLLLVLAAALALATPTPAAASWWGTAARAIGGEDGFERGDPIRLLVNKAGPFDNPAETYNFRKLPFCRPRPDEKPQREWGGLGEVLLGNQPEDSQVEGVEFGVDARRLRVCSQTLTDEDAMRYRQIVQQHYYYEWMVDGLPVWGFVGEMRPPRSGGGGGGDDDRAEGEEEDKEEDERDQDTEDEQGGDGNLDAFGDRRKGRRQPGGNGGAALPAAARAQQRGERVGQEDLLLEPRMHGPPMQVWVYTHRRLDISTNGRHVIAVNLTSSQPKLADPGRTLTFSLEVRWRETQVTFRDRFDRYLDPGFFGHTVHTFALANAFLMVLFLSAVVAAILARTLRADLLSSAARSSVGGAAASGADLEALERDLTEESGWKLMSGDVARAPPHLALLCCCAGTGAQLAAMAVAGTAAALLGAMHEDRGAVLSTLIISYLLASALGGYVSGGMFARRSAAGGAGGGGGNAAASGGSQQQQHPRWARVMLLCWALFPGAVWAVGAACNAVAVAYGSLAAVPATTALALLALWVLVALPLTALGTFLGRARAAAQLAAAAGGSGGKASFSFARIKRLPTPIPPRPWYASRPALALAAGALPFASVFTELFFVFSSIHGFRVFYAFGFLLAAQVSFLLVSALAGVVLTFSLLQREDWRWPWAAFWSGGSTGLYVLLYLAYYYVRHTRMTGLLQAAFFFGYGMLAAAGIGLIAGAAALGASSAFVAAIYAAAKAD
jgi:transmembrane 9 superfamily protein 3